jgi:transcriptional regulator with XRE-family HTH domain
MPTATDISRLRLMCRDGTARQVREAADLSLSDIARDVGCTAASISRYETGLIRPGRRRAVAYLAVLDALTNQERDHGH